MSRNSKRSKLQSEAYTFEMEECKITPKIERQTSAEYASNMDTAHYVTLDNVPSNQNNVGHGVLAQTCKKQICSGMSLWAKTQLLPPEYLKQIETIYATKFPIEVRHYFAEWIEEQPWSQVDETNSQHEQYAVTLLVSLLQLIQQKSDELPTTGDYFLLKLRFQNVIDQLRETYEPSPLAFVKTVKSCLTLEESLVNQAENPSLVIEDPTVQQLATNKQISKDIDTLQTWTSVTDTDIKQLQDKQEALIIHWKNSPNITAQLGNALNQLQQKLEFAKTQIQQWQQGGDNQHELEKLRNEKEELMNKEKEISAQQKNVQTELSAKAQEVMELRSTLLNKYKKSFLFLEDVQKKVIDVELIAWKRKQQLSGNGAPIEEKLLDRLQSWSESLAEIIWKSRQQILQFEVLRTRLPLNTSTENQSDILPDLNQKITALLSSLVTSTFVVEHQPPQVLKKESRFTAKIRLLVGGKLNIHMNPPTVKASIISEEQARGLLKSDVTAKDADSGDILNKEGTMEYHDGKGELSIQFRNMQLKKIKRADKKGTEAVTEEKFCILFQSDFQLGINGELMFQVWTLSLPVVVTVHGNQECNALATVLWDNQFAEPVIISSFQKNGRTPFQVPSQVSWTLMSQLLNTKFQAVTGKGLCPENLNYLASKVFGGNNKTDEYSKHNINWSLFNKDTLPGRSFTFWEWFYAVMRLTKDHLKSLWCDKTIIGFVSKQQAQEWLQMRPVGTFLCRFSDSELGGVTIAWSAEDPKSPGERQVWNLAPYGTKEINIRTLADRIKDLPQLTHLFPDIPKDQAFSKYYTTDTLPDIKDPEGYIKTHLINTLTTPGAAPMNYDNPSTPQAIYNGPDSPASIYSQPISTPGSNVTSTNNNLMDLGAIAEASEDDMLDAFISLDYNADNLNDMSLMEILPSMMANN
ncbi:signal transducer and activator of transcription 5B-like isoform X1 [Mytilus trossulus]|uniref:signal transducer and activator of transcription 5B-like isoform X1 n=2 Tax=Mytilus trossulus TaxID=6551 RepID=UPI003003AF59